MPGSIIGEFILQPIGEIAGYMTGRLVVPVLTLGQVRVERITKGDVNIPRQKGYIRDIDGKIVLNGDMGTLVGVLFWVFIGISIFLIKKSVSVS
ncbi:hypothetical protein [Sideroxydans sp. CL21]|uniref:hypothetical protein n=1 Tax=Sideroxydans sp. CL21 TaxID=2600596 RepID=UPI0024BD2677|nr:hypothetical protein [Sideroxydans sp. CL21]